MINAIEKPAIFIDHSYIIKAINQAYSDHYVSEVVVGKSYCYQISHQAENPCDQHGEDCPLAICKESNKSHRVLHIHKNGSEKEYCDILMRPVVNDDGITVGFLEILDQVSYASHRSANDKLIGLSSAFKQMVEMINRCAQSDISVLLHGETGTGKELVANAIHQASVRKDHPFVVVECTGLTETLFESELFGHEKGAFTGATTSKKGLIDLAHGGTLFLDEVGDIPLNLQIKLLRLLETGSYRAVGGMATKHADFRLICASHKNLPNMVKEQHFRQDLYYRLAAFPLYLPSLSQRKEDIPLLAKHYLGQSSKKQKSFSAAALTTLMLYPFPGNVRELKNIVERAILMSDDDLIDINCLGLNYELPNNPVNLDKQANTLTLAQLEQHYLRIICQNNTHKTAQEIADMLGVSKRTFYRKLQLHHISY
ncbi:MAG: Fis family transcriptional regulator [Gammaproteobacteria bacterium]|nr:MAG: Fis family transcriptional regulator [Gammaproteobacteria bacterium]